MDELACGDEPEPLRLFEYSAAEHADRLKDELLRRRGSDVRIDGSEVGFLSALAAQVLLSAKETWRLDDAHFQVASPSPELKADLDLLGLNALLDADQPQPERAVVAGVGEES